jgi:UvrD-like helicase C-terminal domain/Overcoming lysogenization defect protein-like, TOPRIM domain
LRHITAGAGLDPIIILSSNSSGEMVVVYPSECFQENSSSLTSRKYVERYMDATKSNMLFSKGVLFVEGISEQLLIPTFTEYIPGCDLEKQHVSVINVGGSTFKHFLPLFGARAQTGVSILQCRVGYIPDGDPKRRRKNQDKARYKKCYPYQIDNNWRSTNNIIVVLNNARTDGIKQKGLRKIDGSQVVVLVGDISKAYEQVKNKNPVMLARSNEAADLLRAKDFAKQKNAQDPWSELEMIDPDRFLFVKAIFEAFMLLKSGRPGSSVRKLLDGFRVRNGNSKVLTKAPYIIDTTKRALALTILCCLQEKYASLCSKPFLEMYNELRAQVSELLPGTILKKNTKGKIKEYAQKFTLRELLDTVKMVDDTRDAKTIHKAKGAEFETVLLYLPNEENLDRIIMPEAIQQEDVGESEEQRIAYVGISRARDNLYISVPMLSRDRKKAFEDKKLPIQIVDLEGSGANSRSV